MLYSITTATRKIHKLSARIRAIPGGSSAGKTIGAIQYLVHRAQRDKVPTITSICSESLPHLKKGAMRDFLDFMTSHNLYEDACWNKSDFTYTFPKTPYHCGGSKIEFFSVNEADRVRGPRRDRLFINEANNVSYETYEQLEIRTNEFVILDWNPVSEFWYYTELKGKEQVEELILTYKDNEALNENIIDSIERRKNRKGWWQVYGLGLLGEIEGKIYNDWRIIEEIPHEARLERYGLDFAFHPDPAVIVAIFYHNGGYILDEICFGTGMDNRQLADTLRNQPKALTIADCAEPKSIVEIRGFGINIQPCERGKDNKKWGINIIQGLRISVTRQSVNIIKEYRNYLWATDRNGKIIEGEPEHQFSHCLTGDTKILLANGHTKNIKDIRVSQIVKTQNGENYVEASWKEKYKADIYEIELSNGYKLKGTGNHKIYTNRGKITIDALRYDDIIEVLVNKKILLWKKQLFSTANIILGTVNIITEQLGCIGQYGTFIMGRYQKDIIFTTKTGTQRIIKSLILNSLKLKSIYQNIIRETGKNKILEKRLGRIAIVLDHLQSYGMLQKKGLNGTRCTEKKGGLDAHQLKSFAKYVIRNIKLISPTEQDFAIRIVKRKHCGQDAVYNLTVANEHNYYANGILVGNSMDAIRYGLTSLAAIRARREYVDSLPKRPVIIRGNDAI